MPKKRPRRLGLPAAGSLAAGLAVGVAGLLGVLALVVGLGGGQLVGDPGVGLVDHLGQGQEVVLMVGIDLLPFLALLIGTAGRHGVEGAFFSVVLPDGDGKGAAADLVGGFVFLGHGKVLSGEEGLKDRCGVNTSPGGWSSSYRPWAWRRPSGGFMPTSPQVSGASRSQRCA